MKTVRSHPILFGANSSSELVQAGEVAAGFARRLGEKLVLVRTLERTSSSPLGARMLKQNDMLRTQELGVETEERWTQNAFDEGLIALATECQARLIILPDSGAAPHRWFHGNVTEQIAKSSPAPMLMVRSSAPLLAWTRGERTLRVFVGCNFSIYAEAALRWVGELQKIGPCAVILGLVDRLSKERAELAIFDALHATEEVPEVATELHRELRATAQRILGIEPDTISVQPGSAQIDAHLVEMASATQADLLVIGTHRWHGLQRLAHPSISRHLLHDAPMSVACVPPKVRHGFPEPISEISRVLIAPDLSPQAEEIISMGYATLRGEGSACLFHNARAGEKPTPYEIEQRLRTLIPVEAGERGISTEIRICEDDDPVEALCQSADHFGADLVCVGSQTTMGGTTANAIVGASARPVLVVRTD